jgi:hypothetical protein
VLKTNLKPYELSFLTNYSVSRTWSDTGVAKSFPVPYIYNSRLIHLQDVQEIFPNFFFEDFGDFESFYNFLLQNYLTHDLSIRIDRYYSMLTPKVHMGAHFITINSILENQIEFYDLVLRKNCKLSKELLQKAVEDKKGIMSFGYIVFGSKKNSYTNIQIEKTIIYNDLKKRVDLLQELNSHLQELGEIASTEKRITSVYLQHTLFGMREADFYHANGRLENFLFVFKYFSLAKSLGFLLIILKYNRIISKYSHKLKKKEIELSDWKNFILEYENVIDFEINLFDRLLKGMHENEGYN